MAVFARDPEGAHEQTVETRELNAWFDAHQPPGELSRRELEVLTTKLAARPDLWGHLVRHSSVQRLYLRLHLDDDCEVWLICWSHQQDTGFHDHDRSRGAVTVVGGAIAERRLAVGGLPTPVGVYPAGATFSFGASHIHDVSQTGEVAATSLHAYSPPLGEMGFYEVEAGGLLTRRVGDKDEEFC